MKRGHLRKTILEPAEKLKVAYAHEILGIEQSALAAIFGVNAGRVAEAIMDVRIAVGLAKDEDDAQ